MKTALVIAAALLCAANGRAQDLFNPDYSVYMALRYVNELQVSQDVVDRITHHRVLIEGAHPEVSRLAGYQAWEPGRFILGLTDEGWTEYQAGGLQPVRDLAAAYRCQAIHANHTLKTVEFVSADLLHSGLLASLFEGLDGVRYGAPYGGPGVDGSTIEVLALGAESRYLYRLAWGDCMMGCYAEHFWEFLVTGDEVTQAGEWGAVSTESRTMGGVKALYR